MLCHSHAMSSAGIVQSTREGHSIDISLRDVSISTRRGGFVVEGINADIPGGSFRGPDWLCRHWSQRCYWR